MADTPEKGYASSKPVFVVDEESGELIPIDSPADAVMPEAKPGYKTGNPLLDELNEEFRQKYIIQKIKEEMKKLCEEGKE